jgi:hypothetical protein
MRRIIMAVGLILALASPTLADTTRCTTGRMPKPALAHG